MNIGFDLDRIFVDHPPFLSTKLVDKFYKKRSYPDLLYRIPSPPEQLLRRLTHYTLFRKAMHDNLDVIEKLALDTNHHQYLISGRFGFLRKATERLIKKYRFDRIFDGMYFNFDNKQPHVFKDAMIKKLHLDTYVDDDLDLLRYLAKHNPKTIFYWLNQEFDNTIESNLFAISKLERILK